MSAVIVCMENAQAMCARLHRDSVPAKMVSHSDFFTCLHFSFLLFFSFSPPLIYSSLLLYTSIFPSHIIFPLISHITGSPCSDRGTCVYLDPSGNTLPSCTILDSKCSATCVCRTDYGGADCSISVSKLETLSSLR
jgi:hypothetical protein